MQGEHGTAIPEVASPTPAASGVHARHWRGGAPHLRTMLASGLGEALWLFVTLRVVLSLFALMASMLFQLPGPCAWENGPLLHTTGLGFRLLGVWQRWDACWYMQIATLGYRPGDVSVAFCPFYPLLMRVVGTPFAGDFVVGGLLVSGLAYIAAMTGLYKLIVADYDEDTARRTVLYLSLFPTAFFLFAPYTEALFLALAVWTLLLARRGAWKWAMLTAFLIGLTRLQGWLLILPLSYEFIRQWRSRTPATGPRPHPAAALVGFLPLAGFLMFIAYSQVVTGWTAFQAQRTWGQTASAPWTAIAISWDHILTHNDLIEALNLVFLYLFTLVLVVGVTRLPFSYTLYTAPQLLVISSRQSGFSPLMSTSRFVLVLFPIFVILAILGKNRRLHYSWLIVSLLLLGFLFYAFLSGPFVA